jgi:hypothetical protein
VAGEGRQGATEGALRRLGAAVSDGVESGTQVDAREVCVVDDAGKGLVRSAKRQLHLQTTLLRLGSS